MVDWLLDPDNLIYVLNGGWILFLLIWSIILQTLERRASQGFVIDYCPGCGAMLSDDGRAWVGKDAPPKKRDDTPCVDWCTSQKKRRGGWA